MTFPKLGTVTEALLALSGDKLSSVVYGVGEVHVITTHGYGKFTLSEWVREGGPTNSQTSQVPLAITHKDFRLNIRHLMEVKRLGGSKVVQISDFRRRRSRDDE